MKSVRKPEEGVIGVSHASVVPAAEPAVSRGQEPGNAMALRGLVHDGNRPLSGVTVRFSGGKTSAETDLIGQFELRDSRPGRRNLNFSHPACLPKTLAYDSRAKQHDSGLNVAMVRSGVITGLIADQSGKPAVEVGVTAMHYRVTWDGARVLLSRPAVRTNDRGEFRIMDLEPGEYFINVSSVRKSSPTTESAIAPTGYATGTTPSLYPGVARLADATLVQVKAGEVVVLRPFTMRAIGFGNLKVTFLNPADEPAKEVALGIMDTVRTITSEGRLFYWGPAVGAGVVGEKSIHLEPGETKEVTYFVHHPGGCQVLARWDTGPGGSVNLRRNVDVTGDEIRLVMPLKRPQGRLRFEVHMEAEGGRLEALPNVFVDLGDGAPDELYVSHTQISATPMTNIDFQERVNIQGRATNLRTDAAGRAELENLFGERYDLYDIKGLLADSFVSAARQDGRDVLRDRISVSAGAVVQVLVRKGTTTLNGVVNTKAGSAIADAFIALVPENGSKLRMLNRTVRSAQDGSFEIADLAPGSYRAFVWDPSQYPSSVRYPTHRHLDPEFLSKFEAQSMVVVANEESRGKQVVLVV